MSQLGYAVVFLSHDKEKTISPKDAKEYQQIGSSMQSSALSVIENMSDIIGYAHPKVTDEGQSRIVLTLRSLDNSVRCGCRFKYIEPEIDFTYDALTQALTKAIDKEAEITNNQYVTDEKIVAPILKEYDYDALMDEFKIIVGELMQTGSATNGPKITQIIEHYLGKGKRISEATRDQAEFIYLIIQDIKADLMS